MNNVVEIGIGIDHKGNADMFDTDSDSDPEKTFQVRSWLKLMTLICHRLILWSKLFGCIILLCHKQLRFGGAGSFIPFSFSV